MLLLQSSDLKGGQPSALYNLTAFWYVCSKCDLGASGFPPLYNIDR